MKAELRFLLISFLIFILTRPLSAAPVSSEELLRLIELRRGSWTSLTAAVELKFKAYSQSAATCEGSLLYNRLDEKILLSCRRQAGETVFIFKTNDRNFELYLPSQKTLYKGNIFALEDSPSIESHLKPLDLYRALKPAIFKADDVLLFKENFRGYSLDVKSGDHWLRKIGMNEEGDILREAYQNSAGNISLAIERSEFGNIRDGSVRTVFPEQIQIKSLKDSNISETILKFQTVSFPASLPDELFRIDAPKNTPIEEIS